MEKNFIYGIIIIAVLYALYRMLIKPNKEFQKELDGIMNSDEYKVKGQFENR